jgi:DNA-binding Xre family transcriptional regulator/mRNA-degrading endonuclease RelE of RelBE toxin-antitoxin system
MDAYRYVVSRSAARQLRRCPRRDAILRWPGNLCHDPVRSDRNVMPLTGIHGAYRRRFGGWRVSYLIDQDLEARAAYAATRAEEKLPAQVVERLCAGESPVRVFREHRALSLAQLAEKSGIAVSYLAAIESGGRRASAKALAALAAVLEVSVEDLRP